MKFMYINPKTEFKNTKARKWLSSLIQKSCWTIKNKEVKDDMFTSYDDTQEEGDFIDSYRYLNKDESGYTCWREQFGAKTKGEGTRLD